MLALGILLLLGAAATFVVVDISFSDDDTPDLPPPDTPDAMNSAAAPAMVPDAPPQDEAPPPAASGFLPPGAAVELASSEPTLIDLYLEPSSGEAADGGVISLSYLPAGAEDAPQNTATSGKLFVEVPADLGGSLLPVYEQTSQPVQDAAPAGPALSLVHVPGGTAEDCGLEESEDPLASCACLGMTPLVRLSLGPGIDPAGEDGTETLAGFPLIESNVPIRDALSYRNA